MKFYCVHPKKYFEEVVLKKGYLEGDKDYYMYPEEYEWLMNQMEKKLPNYKKEEGITWLWIDRPDLRQAGHGEPGEECVLLEVELDRQDVLLSDYKTWHCILNGSPILPDEAYEDDDYMNKFYKFKNLMHNTWRRVYDLNWLYYTNKDEIKLQGTTGKISMDKIKVLKYFVSR